jgi:ribosomal protein L40E
MRHQIKLFDRSYQPPALAGAALAERQSQMRVRQRAIREGVREQPPVMRLVPRAPLWGIFPRSPIERLVSAEPAPLSASERFNELRLLVQDYDAIIRDLIAGKERYDAFLRELGEGVRAAVERKMKEIRVTEATRAIRFDRARAKNKPTLEQPERVRGEQLLQIVRVLVHATLLILKKVELCREGLNQLAQDQATQRKILEDALEELQDQEEGRRLDEEIARIGRDVAAMANVALNFDRVLEQGLGPLKNLVDQVAAVDKRLHGAMLEIEGLARTLEGEQLSLLAGDDREDRLVEFVVASAFKRDRVVDALEKARDWDDLAAAIETSAVVGTESDIGIALDNLGVLLDARLPHPVIPALPRSDGPKPELSSCPDEQPESRDRSGPGARRLNSSIPEPELLDLPVDPGDRRQKLNQLARGRRPPHPVPSAIPPAADPASRPAICLRCRYANSPTAKFCGTCGSKLAIIGSNR